MGSHSADLGQHMVGDGEIELEHTFQLFNRSSRNLRIAKVATTCGCSLAEVSSNNIPPEASFEVRAKLKLSGAGQRTVQVHLICEDREPILLSMAATGQVTKDFFASNSTLLL